MKVLGIESSGTRGGVALLDGDAVLGSRIFEKGMVHGREIAPAIRDLADAAGLRLEEIDLVAVDLGPGSYTGLRVGLAAAKGLALALSKPVAGVASLDAIAEAGRGLARTVCVAVDAKWEQIYGAVYDDGVRSTEYLAEKPADFAARVPKGALVLGDALDAFGGLFRDVVPGPREHWDPRPEIVARLGRRLHESGVRSDAATLVPLYLRKTEAELKAEERRPKTEDRRPDGRPKTEDRK